MNNTFAYEFIDSYNDFVLNDYENHNHIISSVFKNQDTREIILSKKKQMIIKRKNALTKFRGIDWYVVREELYDTDRNWLVRKCLFMELYLVNKYQHSNRWDMKQTIKKWSNNTLNYIRSKESTVQQKTNYVIRNSGISDSVVEEFISQTVKGRFYTLDKDTTINHELIFNNIKYTEIRAKTHDAAHRLFRKHIYDYTYNHINLLYRGEKLGIYRMYLGLKGYW
tara:strand:+ start:13 stop:684 length:672 start_codon:yes stop_codon:yes gene_type:complete